MSTTEYGAWRQRFICRLEQRFCICLNDCLSEEQLESYYRAGESIEDILDQLKAKYDLEDS